MNKFFEPLGVHERMTPMRDFTLISTSFGTGICLTLTGVAVYFHHGMGVPAGLATVLLGLAVLATIGDDR